MLILTLCAQEVSDSDSNWRLWVASRGQRGNRKSCHPSNFLKKYQRFLILYIPVNHLSFTERNQPRQGFQISVMFFRRNPAFGILWHSPVCSGHKKLSRIVRFGSTVNYKIYRARVRKNDWISSKGTDLCTLMTAARFRTEKSWILIHIYKVRGRSKARATKLGETRLSLKEYQYRESACQKKRKYVSWKVSP